ncbi:MAG TPA: MarR family transcriptional regulator [Solirubrobacteraceae bacterium]|nr:MarR family transcriptional regulator [Solirubrobacteraceae bacterium]
MAVTSARGTITLLSRLSKSVYRKTPESLLGMSLRHYLALSYVADPGGISQQQLSEILCIDANNTVLLLNEMEGQGLIRRVRDPADRRRHLVEVTGHGQDLFERAQRAREGVEDEVLATLTTHERATLHKLLAKALGD